MSTFSIIGILCLIFVVLGIVTLTVKDSKSSTIDFMILPILIIPICVSIFLIANIK